MNISRWVLSLSLVVAVAASASADIRIPGQPYRGPAKRPDQDPPRPPESARTASFEVLVATSGGSGTPQLVIPREAVKGMLADAGQALSPEADRMASAAPTAPPTAVPNPVPNEGAVAPETTATHHDQAGMPRMHSIVAGLAMAFAVALGGVWIARTRGRTHGRGLALLISASLCLGASLTAWANVPPPPKQTTPPSDPPVSTRLETAFIGKVQVKFVSGDGAVQLVLPHADLLKLVEKEAAKR